MPGRLEFDLGFGRPGRRRDEGEPMRLLLVGDFSGGASADRPPLARRPAFRADLDNLDDLVKRLGPRVRLPSGEMDFQRIDDFHPDRLYERLGVFRALREARINPPSGHDEEIGRLLGKPPTSGAAPTPAATPADGVDALIQRIVAPHIVKDTSAEQRSYLAAVDAAIAEQMRSLLHAPGFQSLESAWRGAHWLASRLELDDNLQLHLFDTTREELVADLEGAGGVLSKTGLYQVLVGKRADRGESWSALVSLIDFGPSDADMSLLSALGLLASHAGGPLLAGANSDLASAAAGSSAGWQALRRSETARWIALAAPRVLLRLPYGKISDPIESFAFEEFVGLPAHDEFLWGSPSLATALLAGRSFTARGWDLDPGEEPEIGDLPAYTFVRDGEREMQACAERFLTESQTDALLNAGLVPLVSRRDRNAIVAVRFQSVSDPPSPLTW